MNGDIIDGLIGPPPSFDFPIPHWRFFSVPVISFIVILINVVVMTIVIIYGFKNHFKIKHTIMLAIGLPLFSQGIWEGIAWDLEFIVHRGYLNSMFYWPEAVMIGAWLIKYVHRGYNLSTKPNRNIVGLLLIILAIILIDWVIAPWPHSPQPYPGIPNPNLFPWIRYEIGSWYYASYPGIIINSIMMMYIFLGKRK